MATAPTPGAVRQDNEAAESAAATKRILVIALLRTGETYKLATANLPLEQRAAVLKQVGISYNSILTSGDDLLITAVAVWLSRRLGGEASLSWPQFQRQWPDLGPGDVDCWAENPQGQRIDIDGKIISAPDDDADEATDEVDDPQS
jgi:hypothetical protein